MDTKICFKCGRELPLSSFYKHPKMGDGHLNKCKDCAKKDVSENIAKKSQDFEWRRKEKKIDILIQLETKDIHLSSKYYSIYMSYMSRFRREFSYISKNFDSYEEALSEGIKEAVKILKEK